MLNSTSENLMTKKISLNNSNAFYFVKRTLNYFTLLSPSDSHIDF